MATPEAIVQRYGDRPIVRTYVRRTHHPITAEAGTERWKASRATLARVRALVPMATYRPAGDRPAMAATVKRVHALGKRFRTRG